MPYEELNNLIKYSVLYVLLTFYDHGNFTSIIPSVNPFSTDFQ